MLKEQKAPKKPKKHKSFEIGAKTKMSPPKKTNKIQNRIFRAKIKVLSTFLHSLAETRYFSFRWKATCINVNSRDHATLVKGTGGELKSEMTDRKHKTGFDRQKINNKRINIQNQFQR